LLFLVVRVFNQLSNTPLYPETCAQGKPSGSRLPASGSFFIFLISFVFKFYHKLNLPDFYQKATGKKSSNKKLLELLKKKKQKEVDEIFHEAHEKVFACTDCLKCANCCKTTGPLFTSKDVERISTHLKMSEKEFENKFLKRDEDNDLVLKKVPCSFLDAENYCTIYDVRPKACREYPHTDRINQQQIFKLTMKNSLVCPAVLEILDDVRKKTGL